MAPSSLLIQTHMLDSHLYFGAGHMLRCCQSETAPPSAIPLKEPPHDMGTPSGCQPNDYLEAVTARREPVAIAANAFEIIRVTAA
jgi:hypothetical protein